MVFANLLQIKNFRLDPTERVVENLDYRLPIVSREQNLGVELCDHRHLALVAAIQILYFAHMNLL